MRTLQHQLHNHVYRPYRPTITWVYKTVHFTFCNETERPHYVQLPEGCVIHLQQDSSPEAGIHEIGHFLYDQLPELLQKQLETKLIQMCSSVKDVTNFLTECVCNKVSPALYSTLIDAHRILYHSTVTTGCWLGHDLDYGKERPVYYATTEAWANACVHYILRSEASVPTIMQYFFNTCKTCLAWLDKNKVPHRNK